MRGRRVFAWCYSLLAPRLEEKVGTKQRRIALLSHAVGQVVEIGAGTGLNLPHYPSTVTDVLATEPDPHMFRRLVRALGSASVPTRARRASAAALPVDEGWADVVVSTLVLCSVPEQASVLAEVCRVLRPGGVLLFYEHVRGPEPLARWQDRLERPWGMLAGGCHPNRSTVAAIEAAGMTVERIERFDLPGTWLARPHVCGVARNG